ncbi:MAG: septum site-determining protein MinC [Thermodesulfobacteriota bacterium]|nr:septum site-determining protein MinC [Thermodesulfobacteriota bacterium]
MGQGETAAVKLKGVGDGFWVTLDPDAPEDDLIAELNRLFKRLRHLTINAKVVIDTGDEKNCEALIEKLGSHLKCNFGIGNVTQPPPKKSVPRERIRQRDASRAWTNYSNNVLMLRGRVRSGQKIEARKHIIITGDVNPGAEIYARGDIYVIGKLLGQVRAGQPDNAAAIVFSLDFRPSQIQIADVLTTGLDKPHENGAEYAFLDQNKNRILVQNYLKTNPFASLPWPEVI